MNEEIKKMMRDALMAGGKLEMLDDIPSGIMTLCNAGFTTIAHAGHGAYFTVTLREKGLKYAEDLGEPCEFCDKFDCVCEVVDAEFNPGSMSRERAIEVVEALYPPDSQYLETALIGQQLLDQAKKEVNSWKSEPTEVLVRLAELCQGVKQ